MNTLEKTLLAFALSFVFAACEWSPDPVAGSAGAGTAPTWDVQVAQPAADLTPFLGAWSTSTGETTATCGQETVKTQVPAGGIVHITAGTAPNEILVNDSRCIVSATVSGDRATGAPEVGCAAGVLPMSLVYTLSGGVLHEEATSVLLLKGGYCASTRSVTLVRR